MDDETLFHLAMEKSPGERSAFLDRECAGDANRRHRVEVLLRSHETPDSFLAGPPVGPGAMAEFDRDLTADAGPAGPDAEDADRRSSPEGPGSRIGPYKLLQQLGEGGMGTVFMAEQEKPVRRRVALKVIKPGMDTRQVVARFEAERQALALMDHVNIARVLDAGATDSGRPYFVMELVHGVPITKYCDDNRLTPRQRLELFVPVCRAVQHAHQKGIIHRDIKPSNVMVTLYDGKPVPKVIDFGVAKATEQKLTERTLFTQYGTLVGTLEYMSPEQAEMSALGVDTRSDVYSLGVLLYELLTGSTPLSRERLRDAAFGEILRMIKEDEPARPSTRLSDSGEALASISANRHTEPARLTKLIRGELDWIVMKTLEKDRTRRYETVDAFAADIQRYLHDEPVRACPPSSWYRFRKFARRNKAGLGVAAVVVLFLMMLGVGVGWAARDRATREAALRQEVSRALEEAEASYRLDRTPEALAAVKRAEGLLAAGGGGSEGLRRRVRRWRSDLDLVARLDEIRLEGAAVKDNHFDRDAADPAYREAFRRQGWDVEALDPDVAAGHLRASAVHGRLVTALDDWALSKEGTDQPGAERLLSIARRADTDPWRARLRDAYGRRDGKALAELARGEQRASQAPQTLSLLAKGLKSTGYWPLGLEVLRAAQSRYAGDFWINLQLGEALRELKPDRMEEATGFYRAALALRPDSAGARVRMGVVLHKQGDLARAEAEYREAIRLKPDFALAHANLGKLLATKGLTHGAVVAYWEAVALDPKRLVSHNDLAWLLATHPDPKLRDPGLAVELARAAVGRNSEDGLSWQTLAWAQYRAGDWRSAVASMEKVKALGSSGDSREWFLLAMAHRQLGHKVDARKWFDRAVAWMDKNDPANGELRGFRDEAREVLGFRGKEALPGATVQVQIGALGAEQLVRLARAFGLHEVYVRLRIRLGNALRDAGHLDAALAQFSAVIAADPKHVAARFARGECYRHRGEFVEAAEDFSVALAMGLDRWDAWHGRAMARLFSRRWDGAVADFSESIKRGPPVHSNWLHRGHAHLNLAQWDRAAADFGQIVDRWPQDPGGWYSRGFSYAQLGEPEKAMADLRKAVALRPEMVEQMKGDPRLDPLRSRDDFKTLLTSFEKAKE